MDWQAPLGACLALVALGWTARQRPALCLTRGEAWTGAWVGIYALLAFFGSRPQRGLDEALILATLWMLAMGWRREQAWKEAVAWTWLAMGSIAAAAFFVAGLLQAPLRPTDSMGSILRAHLSSRWVAPNQNLLAACLSAPALLLGLAWWVSGRQGRQRAWAMVAMVAGGAACVYAGSRGVWLGLCVAMAWMVLRWPTGRRRQVLLGVALVVGGLFLGARYAPFSSTRLRSTLQADPQSADPNSVRRLDFWRGALGLSLRHPWLGFGPASFSLQARQLDLPTPLDAKRPVARYRLVLEHAHDEWLELAVEAGWPMALAALGLVMAWLYRRLRGEDGDSTVVGLEAGMVLALVLSLTDMNLRTPGPLLGLALVWATLEQGAPPTRGGWSLPRWAPWAMGCVLVAAMLGWWQRESLHRSLQSGQAGTETQWNVVAFLQPLDGEAAAWRIGRAGFPWPWDAWCGRYEPAWWWAQASREGAAGHVQAGLADSRQALALTPHDAIGWLQYGLRLDATGDLDGAGEAVDRALALEPNFSRAWAYRCDRALSRHDQGAARAAYHRIEAIQKLVVQDEDEDAYSSAIQKIDPLWMKQRSRL